MKLLDYLRERTSLSEYNLRNLRKSNPHEKIVLDLIREPQKLEVPGPLELFVRVPIVNPFNVKFMECCPDLIGFGPDNSVVIVTAKYAERPCSRTKAMDCMFTQLINAHGHIKHYYGIDSIIRGVYREGNPAKREIELLNVHQLDVCRRPITT